MKRHSLDITSGDQLKVKRQTIIRTQKTLSQQNESDDEESEILVVHHVTIKELDEEEPFEDEVHDAPPALEYGGQATIDELKELNLGTNEDPRPIFVSALLNPSEEESYHQMLLEYKDVFTWTYKQMPGLDPKVAVHHLAVKPGTRLIKQTQCRFRPKLLSQIEAEVDKLIAAGFIREDDFPLPIIELMVDATTGHEALSVMDGSSGYNQIRMWLEDEELTAFRTPKGIYCYNVMPFGLKNAGATYQCAMQKIFGEMLHKNVECYVDDLMIKYVTSKPVLTGRLAKWALPLNQYEIIYTPTEAVKGQAVANFLADHPIPADWEISDDLPDKQVFFADVSPAWMMFFDGSARKDGAGAGVFFVSPETQVLPYSFTLSELCSNNVAEYQALIIGLQMAMDMKISSLEVYGDSMLVINQLLTHYEVRKDDLIPYHQMATQLLEMFDFVTLEHVPRKDNQMANALANLTPTMALTKDEVVNLPVCQRWVIPLILGASQERVNVISVLSIDADDWRQPLIDYLEHGKLPNDSRLRSEVRRRAPRFIYYKEILYRRSFEGLFLICLGEEDASKAMEKAHSGICGAHQSGPKQHLQIKRMGYYWPTMVKDCMDYVKKWQACQFHANFIHQPSEPLHPTITS
ncbi:unnamed protein product [Prunus armeniaca]